MSFINKPKVAITKLPKNGLGLRCMDAPHAGEARRKRVRACTGLAESEKSWDGFFRPMLWSEASATRGYL